MVEAVFNYTVQISLHAFSFASRRTLPSPATCRRYSTMQCDLFGSYRMSCDRNYNGIGSYRRMSFDRNYNGIGSYHMLFDRNYNGIGSYRRMPFDHKSMASVRTICCSTVTTMASVRTVCHSIVTTMASVRTAVCHSTINQWHRFVPYVVRP